MLANFFLVVLKCGLDISKMEHLMDDLAKKYRTLIELNMLPENIEKSMFI